ncbi:response regulator [Robbsia sp. KACC 23696]|uniref:response regulator n=1 Tax=Robbsia sp. KACC 23696 TaxID=3149231 RepID=UPI00325B14B4
MTSSLDFSTLFDASPAPCAVLDLALRTVAVNRAYLAAMACEREDIVGQYWFDAFPDYTGALDVAAPITATIASVSASAAALIRDSVHRARATGLADTLPCVRYPIRARRPVEKARASHAGEEAGERAVAGPLLDRYWRITHTPVSGADGTSAHVLQHCTDVTQAQWPGPALDAGRTQIIEALQRDRTDLEGLVRESVQALRDSESERRQTEAALAQAQKMEAVGKLTGGVAHDFNNVLQIISGNVQLADRDLKAVRDSLPAPRDARTALAARVSAAHTRLETALEAVARGAKLASQLLAFARRQPLQPRVVEPRALCLPMVDMMRRLLGETIRVETLIADGLQPAWVDANQLENVLLNLAVNARDAMDGEGILTIRVENAVIDSAFASLHPGLRPGEYVMFALMDDGCGMPPDVLDRVFEPFYTTKPPGQGTGLGLSMAYGFAKQSNGHIYIDSVVGKGTAVRLYLPRAAQDVVRPDVPSSAAAQKGASVDPDTDDATCDADDGSEVADVARVADTAERFAGSGTILVAEDDSDVRATVVALIEGLGYSVLACDSGEAAVDVLQRPAGANVVLLFSDVVMPGPLRGAALLSAVRAVRPGLPVMFTSGYTDEELAHGGRLDPTVCLLAKPYDQAHLARTLHAMLDGVTRHGALSASARSPLSAKQAVQDLAQEIEHDIEHDVEHDKAARLPSVPSVGSLRSARAGLSILLVEDDANAREASAALLEALGHCVRSVDSGEHAILALSGWDPDLLVTDLNLPGMSGAELARRVDLPVVVISGMALKAGGTIGVRAHGQPSTPSASDDVGGTDDGLPAHVVPLCKPFDLDALTEAIDAALSCHEVPEHEAAAPRVPVRQPARSGTRRHDRALNPRHSPRGRAGHA